MSMILDGSNGVTFNDSSLQGAAASPYVLKNYLINGSMQIWQRGTSFSNPANLAYTMDRWFSYFGTTNRTISQQTGFSGFQYCTRLQRTNGTTDTSSSGFGQIIEANNLYALQGQTVTLSFYARAGSNFSSSGNSLVINTTSGTTADQGSTVWWSPGWAGGTSPYSANVTLTTTATRYSVNFTVPANCLELFIGFQYPATGTAGANDYFEITGVQLEIGSTATPFERRLYNQELANCQRYFQICGFSGWTASTTQAAISSNFKVTMRSTPSMGTVLRPNTDYTGTDNRIIQVLFGNVTTTAASYDQGTANNIGNLITSGLNANSGIIGSYQASAEL